MKGYCDCIEFGYEDECDKRCKTCKNHNWDCRCSRECLNCGTNYFLSNSKLFKWGCCTRRNLIEYVDKPCSGCGHNTGSKGVCRRYFECKNHKDKYEIAPTPKLVKIIHAPQSYSFTKGYVAAKTPFGDSFNFPLRDFSIQ